MNNLLGQINQSGGPPIGLIVVGGIIFLVVVYFISIANRLYALRQHVQESWSNVETELRRRHDLIPNLVRVVKGYAAHEKELLERLMKLRSQADDHVESPREVEGDEREITRGLGRLMALREEYPDLKASEQFLRLQEELIETEDRIQAARRFYNGNVRAINIMVQSFPSSIVANMNGVQEEQYFQFDPVAAPQTKF